jgi:hypothetical protein
MKMHVWTDHYSFLAVAHSDSVATSREMLLAEIGTTDGSTPEINAAREWVLGQTPNIWAGPNSEFVITDSAEVQRLERRLEDARTEAARLREALAAARQGCSCSLRERESGHRTDCFVPELDAALSNAPEPVKEPA